MEREDRKGKHLWTAGAGVVYLAAIWIWGGAYMMKSVVKVTVGEMFCAAIVYLFMQIFGANEKQRRKAGVFLIAIAVLTMLTVLYVDKIVIRITIDPSIPFF